MLRVLEFFSVKAYFAIIRIGFCKELLACLDPMHGDFSRASGIMIYQLTHPWAVPEFYTQLISVSNKDHETGHISPTKAKKPA